MPAPWPCRARGVPRPCRAPRALHPAPPPQAWENGAQNDAWWEGTDEAFASWDKAIEDSGLTWKYRQVEDGEWDVLEKLGDERYRGQGGHGKGRIDRGVLQEERLDRPLPWDHINTGVSKFWLKVPLPLSAPRIPPLCPGHCAAGVRGAARATAPGRGGVGSGGAGCAARCADSVTTTAAPTRDSPLASSTRQLRYEGV